MTTEVIHYQMKKKILEISRLQVLEFELCQLGNMLNPLFPRELNHDVTLFFQSLILTFGGKSCHIFWLQIFCYLSKLLSIFISFFKEIKNQFGQVIKNFM